MVKKKKKFHSTKSVINNNDGPWRFFTPVRSMPTQLSNLVVTKDFFFEIQSNFTLFSQCQLCISCISRHTCLPVYIVCTCVCVCIPVCVRIYVWTCVLVPMCVCMYMLCVCVVLSLSPCFWFLIIVFFLFFLNDDSWLINFGNASIQPCRSTSRAN